tara:strand:+ start:524 stop:1618 length:1095 start_codon:yes stop_codon:yes gene_type:complete
MKTFEILDRFELLYPTNSKLADLRRSYIDKDLSSIFRLTEADEELRKAVIEKNIHSIFRMLDNEELRKAVIEENLHSIFRIVDNYDTEELRKAVTEKNLHSIFRLSDADDNISSAVTEENLHSIFRLVIDEDLRKLIIEDNTWKLWDIINRYVDTQFIWAFKNFFVNETVIDDDCFSRGQLKSKQWLIDTLTACEVELGTVFLCAGWYATLATMLFESNIKVDKVRSFDIDPSCRSIAETFNKPWVKDEWLFKACTKDIMDINYEYESYEVQRADGTSCPLNDTPNTIINTSCEHIPNFKQWYDKIPAGRLVILQGNNYFEIEEHVNCATDLDDFSKMSPMEHVYYEGELELEKYKRYMKIGYK